MAHGDGCHAWTLGLRVCWDNPRRGLDRVFSPQGSLAWGPTCQCMSLLVHALGWYGWACNGLMASGTDLGVAQQGMIWAPAIVPEPLHRRAEELYHTALLQGITREAHAILSPCTALPSHPLHLLGGPCSCSGKLSAAARFLPRACRSLWLRCAEPYGPPPLEGSCRVRAAAGNPVLSGQCLQALPFSCLGVSRWCPGVLWSRRLGRELCCSRLHLHPGSWRARSPCPNRTLRIKRKQVSAPGLAELARYRDVFTGQSLSHIVNDKPSVPA